MKRQLTALLAAISLCLTPFTGVARADFSSSGTSVATVMTDVTDLSLAVAPGGKTQATISVIAPSDTPVSVSGDASWLTVSPSSFRGSATVTVHVNAKEMVSGDVQLSTVTFNAGASGTVVVPVVVTVAVPDDKPAMAANPTRLDLDTVQVNKTVVKTLTLEFGVPLSGVISSEGSWIDVTPKVFTNTTRQTVLVKASTNDMINGQVYTAKVAVRSGNYPTLEVPVIVKIGNPPPPKRVFKSTFRDVPDDHWAIEAIMTLSELKVISGLGNGTYAPDQMVTREQFAKLLVGALRLPAKPAPAGPVFTDVPADRWSAAYIDTVKHYLTGYGDGLFRPEAVATREDMAVALVRAKGFDKEPPVDPAELDAQFSDAAKISPAIKPLVSIAVAKGLMKGFDDGTFRPQEPLTRAQAAVLLHRASQVGGNEKK